MNWDLCESPYDAQVRISLDSFVLKRNLQLPENGNQFRDHKEATVNKRSADNSQKNSNNKPQASEENEMDLSDLVKGSRFMCGASSATCTSLSTTTNSIEGSASSSFFNASSNMSINHDERCGSFMNDSVTSLSSRKNMKRMHKKKQKYRQLLTTNNGKGDTKKCAQLSLAVTSTREYHNGLTKIDSRRDATVPSTKRDDENIGSKRIDATVPDTKSDELITAKRKDANECTKEPIKTNMINAERDSSKSQKVLVDNDETSYSKKERNCPLDDSLHNTNKMDKQRDAQKAAEAAKPSTAKEPTGTTVCNKTNNKTRQGLAAVSALASKNTKPKEVDRREKLRRAVSDLGNRSAPFMEIRLEKDNNADAISCLNNKVAEAYDTATSPPRTMDRRQLIKRTVSNLARSSGGEGISQNRTLTGDSTSSVRIPRRSSAEHHHQHHHQQELPVVNVGPASRLVGTRFEAVARAAGVQLRQTTSVAGDGDEANVSTLSRSSSLRATQSQQARTSNDIATKSLPPKAKSARHLNKNSTTSSSEISYFDWDKYARGQCGCGLNNTIH